MELQNVPVDLLRQTTLTMQINAKIKDENNLRSVVIIFERKNLSVDVSDVVFRAQQCATEIGVLEIFPQIGKLRSSDEDSAVGGLSMTIVLFGMIFLTG